MSRVYTENTGGTYSIVGPLRWMAPEALTQREYCEKTDLWSFGVTIFELASRGDPYSYEMV